jgi:hypothetical protein
MRSWPALLLAPLTALAQQAICLSLTEHACEQQTTVALHAVCAVGFLAILAMTAMAAVDWRASAGIRSARASDTARALRPRFIAAAASLVGALSALASLSMWMPVWVLGPCMT